MESSIIDIHSGKSPAGFFVRVWKPDETRQSGMTFLAKSVGCLLYNGKPKTWKVFFVAKVDGLKAKVHLWDCGVQIQCLWSSYHLYRSIAMTSGDSWHPKTRVVHLTTIPRKRMVVREVDVST